MLQVKPTGQRTRATGCGRKGAGLVVLYAYTEVPASAGVRAGMSPPPGGR